MAKGETRFSSEGRKIHKFENQPIPAGDYGLTLLGKMEIKKSQEKGPDAIPYVSVRFAADGTAAKEGGKDRLAFHQFYLSLKPGKDGIVMADRSGQIVEFYRAHGEELDVPTITKTLEDGSKVDYLDPEAIIEQLEEWTDTTTDAHLAVEPAKDRTNQLIAGAPGRNRIANFKVSDGEKEENTDEDKDEAPAKASSNGLKKKSKR